MIARCRAPIAFLLATMLLAIGCAPRKPAPAPTRPTAPVHLGTLPKLEATVGSHATDGGLMRLRGSVRNQLPGTVQGVRLVLVIYPAAEPGQRELERQQRELQVTLASGASTAVAWDVESSYLQGGAAFALRAYPAR
jgi:hypothetical protein